MIICRLLLMSVDVRWIQLSWLMKLSLLRSLTEDQDVGTAAAAVSLVIDVLKVGIIIIIIA